MLYVTLISNVKMISSKYLSAAVIARASLLNSHLQDFNATQEHPNLA